MRTLDFLSEASDEAAAAVAYYEEGELGLGTRLWAQIETAAASIVADPFLWRERPGGYRRANLPGFPFYIAYFVRGERVIVAAIGHASRHPVYWKGRAPKVDR